MKSITWGLALSLLGGVAAAQTAPAPRPPAAAPTPPAPTPPAPPQDAQSGQPALPAPSGPPEGMVVETPDGFYLVRPGGQPPQRLDLGRGGGPEPRGMARGGAGQDGMGRPMAGQSGPAAMAEGDDGMDEMEGGPRPMPPRPPRGMPPRPPEGKGARFRIKTPNLTLGVKCPDDEPVKACMDAVSQLLDKANQPR